MIAFHHLMWDMREIKWINTVHSQRGKKREIQHGGFVPPWARCCAVILPAAGGESLPGEERVGEQGAEWKRGEAALANPTRTCLQIATHRGPGLVDVSRILVVGLCTQRRPCVLVLAPDSLLKGACCGSQVAEEDEMNPRVLPILCKVCELVVGGLAQPSTASKPDTADQATTVGPGQSYHRQGCLTPVIKLSGFKNKS